MPQTLSPGKFPPTRLRAARTRPLRDSGLTGFIQPLYDSCAVQPSGRYWR